MRSIYRTLGPELARSIALVCLADALVGLSFGAIAVGDGLPLWVPILLSVVVFAGAAQFLFVGLVAAGGNPFAAVAAGLLVNARHLPFGFAVADVLRKHRFLGAHVMTDEAVAFTLAQDDPAWRRKAYWATGIPLFVIWNLAVVLGGLLGAAIHDTDALGLDAAFPAVLLALVLPSLTDAKTRWAALVGLVIALATTPFLPSGAPVLLGLAGVAVVAPFRRKRKRAPA
jgi:4-azaleucine resistance transporter AzlC